MTQWTAKNDCHGITQVWSWPTSIYPDDKRLYKNSTSSPLRKQSLVNTLPRYPKYPMLHKTWVLASHYIPLAVLRLFISSGFIGEDTFSMSSCAACTARAAAVFISHESFFRGNQGFQLALNLDNVSEPIVQWIGLKENLQETMVFTKYRGSCKFSHHPILWIVPPNLVI